MRNSKKHFLVAGIAALLMAGSLGLNLNTIGVYLQPIANSLGVTTGDISMHSTLISIGIAFGAFLIPPVLKRFSFRLVVLIATLFTAGATFGMSFATEVWMFNVLGLIRGVGSAFFGIVALQLLINNWFIKRHGMITSIVFSFSGIAGAIFSPILSNIIQSQGWRMAFSIQALLFVLLSLPGILIPYKLSPYEEGLEPYGYSEEDTTIEQTAETDSPRKSFSFGSVTFISTIIFAVLIASLTALNQHLAEIGIDFGFTATTGALMISACMIGNIVFKLVIGMISDSIGTIIALLSMVGTLTIGLVLLLIGQSDLTVLTGSFLLGAMYSVAAVGLSIFVKHIYSDKEFSKVFPLVNFMSNIGGAIAVSAYGYSFDLSGGYNFAIIASIVITVTIAVLILIANRTSLVTNT